MIVYDIYGNEAFCERSIRQAIDVLDGWKSLKIDDIALKNLEEIIDRL